MKKDLAGVTTITLNGVDYTSDSLTKLLQSFVDKADGAVTAKGAWRVAVTSELAMHATVVAVLAALRSFVVLKFSENAEDILADFGFAPRKKVVKTARAKADAADKAKATKAARHPTSTAQGTAAHDGATPTAAPVSPATTTTQPVPAANPQAPVAPKS